MNNINRIAKAFENKKENKRVLIAFITGGDPDIETTEKLIPAMAESGVDIIEIGIPFSDPVAEGPDIEAADKRALDNGCTTDKLFDMVKRVRAKTDIPLLFATYANPVYSYGKDRFMAKCKECGIDGILIPDVPFEEKDEFKNECRNYDIMLISMIAPTSRERIEKIAQEAQGFLYCVSSPGVTGMQSDIIISELIKQVKKVSPVPCVVECGISAPEQVRDRAAIVDGVIISSAIVNLIAEAGKNSVEPVKNFIGELKNYI